MNPTARSLAPQKRSWTRKDGTVAEVWRGRYVGPDGLTYTRSGFARKRDADTWAGQQVADARRGQWVDPAAEGVTFAEWADKWLAAKRRLGPRTANDYRKLIEGSKEHCLNRSFGHMPLVSIQRIDAQGWIGLMEGLDLAPNTIRNYFRLLHQILEAATHDDLLVRNIAHGVELPAIAQAERRFYTAEQVNDLAWSFPDRSVVLPYVLAWGGLRWGEAAALRRRHCHLRRLHVTESLAELDGRLAFKDTKTHQARWVSLPPDVADLLAEHLERHVGPDPDALVFTAPRGGPLRYANFRRNVWDAACEAAGLPGLTPHELRHTCASLMRHELGADAHQVQRQLGHRRTSTTTDLYQHMFEGELETVMERSAGLVRRTAGGKRDQKRDQNVVALR